MEISINSVPRCPLCGGMMYGPKYYCGNKDCGLHSTSLSFYDLLNMSLLMRLGEARLWFSEVVDYGCQLRDIYPGYTYWDEYLKEIHAIIDALARLEQDI